jgi:hypothetical protein
MNKSPELLEELDIIYKEYKDYLEYLENIKNILMTKILKEYKNPDDDEINNLKSTRSKLKILEKKMDVIYNQWIEENNRIYKDTIILSNNNNHTQIKMQTKIKSLSFGSENDVALIG